MVSLVAFSARLIGHPAFCFDHPSIRRLSCSHAGGSFGGC
jgi:hypothetical protein